MATEVTSFSKAIAKLTLTNPFFTALLYGLRHKRDENLPSSAATDGITLFWNPTWFDKFDNTEACYTLVHEIMHVVLYHNTRRGARDPYIWNVACDHAVNLVLKQHNFQPYSTDYCDPKYENMTAERIYDELIKSGMKPQPQPSAGQGGKGDQPDPKGQGPRSNDVVDYRPSEHDNQTVVDMERNVGINVEKALQVAKAAGQLTEEQRRQLREAQVIREPWYNHLRRYMNTLCSKEYNWARINSRRAACFGIISPDMRQEQMGKIVWSIDESGSLSDEMLAAIAAHGSDICRECAPKEVVIIRHTDRVTHVETYEGPNYDIKLERKSTGGTDFRPVFEELEAHHNDAQVVLMFTDLYGPFPDIFNGCDTIWVTSTDSIIPPFGEIIQADFND
jgi:predicted metal-dependent peptidase